MDHGASRYSTGCRCDVCRRAHADYMRAWSRRNKERVAATAAKSWRAKSDEEREARREYMRRYFAKPRRAMEQRVRLRMRKRREQGKDELDKIPPGLVDHLLRLMEAGRCCYCGAYPLKLEIEHVDSNGPTTIENTTVACRKCNQRKYNGTADEIHVPRHLKSKRAE